jgi:NAD(P)-dependent dehydrogenase (short-subunit alcohol dehydrogenase family)
MTRGILLAGNESPLLFALSDEAAKRVQSHVAAYIPRDALPRTGAQAKPQAAEAGRLEWNPSSPVSACTLVLEAQNRLGHIDDAILVCVPPAYRAAPDALSLIELDRFIDTNIKSWFFLARELAAVFQKRASGTLTLALQGTSAASREEAPDLAGPAAAASFRALTQSLLSASANAPYNTMGFLLPESGEENAFAAHVFKTMEEGRKNSGKWHKYGKFGLFGR